MVQKKRRAKNEPSVGDKLHQAYRNRAAMHRVYQAARSAKGELIYNYWTPTNMDFVGEMY